MLLIESGFSGDIVHRKLSSNWLRSHHDEFWSTLYHL